MTDNAPKSALDLAMERLRQKDKESNAPERPLTDEQKAAIAEVRQMYQAKTAEHEILHQAALRKAGSHEEVAQLNEALRRDTERMVGERDRKIAAIREGGEHMAKGRSMQKEKKKPKKEKK
jgi:ATP phosphoribosyltransferase regulatory subunit HisZ